MNIAKLLLIMTVASFAAVGCDNDDGDAENLGESIDNAATDAGNAIEDACEDVKEGADADDTDC